MTELPKPESSFLGILRDLDLQKILAFGFGLSLGVALAVSLDATRFLPVVVAFGLLCFGLGIVLMEFVSFWRKREECIREGFENLSRWQKEFNKLDEEKSKWEEEKEDWDAERRLWEAKRDEWEAEKELAIRKEALRLLNEHAGRRGGEQIDRDMDPDDEEPEEEK